MVGRKISERKDLTAVLFIKTSHNIDKIKSKIDSFKFVKETLFQSSKVVTANLISKYELDEIVSHLKYDEIPDILKISFDEELLCTAKIDSLENLIKEFNDEIILEFDNESLISNEEEIKEINKKEILFKIFFLILIFIIGSTFRILFELKNNKFWTVLIKAGGDSKKRRYNFAKVSIIIIFVPSILSIIMIYFSILREISTDANILKMIISQTLTLFASQLVSLISLRNVDN